MPPTISVTVGRDEAAAFEAVALVAVAPTVPLELPELLQAATPAARAATLATLASLIRVGLGMDAPWCVGWGSGMGLGFSGPTGSGGGGFGLGRRAPGQQAPFQQADKALGGQRQDRDDEHGGEYAVRVEIVLRGGDHQPEAALGAEELPDDRADDGEPECDVQAGDDPGQR